MSRHQPRRIHESTSRALCRAAFVLLGVLPLLFCTWICFLPLVPGHGRSVARQWSMAMSSELGLAAQVASVDPLAPNTYRLHGVVWRHPETEALIARCDTIEIQRRQNQWLSHTDELWIDPAEVELAGTLLHQTVLCRPSRAPQAVVLAADRVQLLREDGNDSEVGSGQHPLLAEQLAVQLLPGNESTWLKLEFASGSPVPSASEQQSQPTPAQLTLQRFHAPQDLETRWNLRTGDYALSNRLLSQFVLPLSVFGDEAMLTGGVDVRQGRGHWQVQSTSNGHVANSAALVVENVDFGRLMGTFPTVTGRGTLRIFRGSITERGISFLAGEARLGPGKVAQRLLSSGSEILGLRLSSTSSKNVLEQSFDEAYLKFQIEPSVLHWIGYAEDQSGALALRDIPAWTQPIALSALVEFCSAVEYDVDVAAAGNLESYTTSFRRWLPLESQEAAAVRTASSESPPHQ